MFVYLSAAESHERATAAHVNYHMAPYGHGRFSQWHHIMINNNPNDDISGHLIERLASNSAGTYMLMLLMSPKVNTPSLPPPPHALPQVLH